MRPKIAISWLSHLQNLQMVKPEEGVLWYVRYQVVGQQQIVNLIEARKWVPVQRHYVVHG